LDSLFTLWYLTLFRRERTKLPQPTTAGFSIDISVSQVYTQRKEPSFPTLRPWILNFHIGSLISPTERTKFSRSTTAGLSVYTSVSHVCTRGKEPGLYRRGVIWTFLESIVETVGSNVMRCMPLCRSLRKTGTDRDSPTSQ